jgi:lipoyl(octanoyl) transferase
LNVNTDLDYFNYIVPCGIQGKSVTSISKELGKEISMEGLHRHLLEAFQEVFGMEIFFPSEIEV